MEVEVFIADRPPIPGPPPHNGKYLVIKLPSVEKNGKFFFFDRKNKQVQIVNFGISYFVQDVPINFEINEDQLRKVNDLVKNSYPDDVIKDLKIINKEFNGNF